MIRNPRTRRLLSGALLAVGGVLLFLAPDDAWIGGLLLFLAITLEVIGVLMQRRRDGRG